MKTKLTIKIIVIYIATNITYKIKNYKYYFAKCVAYLGMNLQKKKNLYGKNNKIDFKEVVNINE